MEKKFINTSFLYAILAMIGGVFYSEFTKINQFVGATALGKGFESKEDPVTASPLLASGMRSTS